MYGELRARHEHNILNRSGYFLHYKWYYFSTPYLLCYTVFPTVITLHFVGFFRPHRHIIDCINGSFLFFNTLYFMRVNSLRLISRRWQGEGGDRVVAWQPIDQNLIHSCWLVPLRNLFAARQFCLFNSCSRLNVTEPFWS